MCNYRFFTRKKIKLIIFTLISGIFLYAFGVFHHPLEKDFYSHFNDYPYNGNIEQLIVQLKHNRTPTTPKVNNYNFYYYKNCAMKCKEVSSLRLVYIVKSAPYNFDRRLGIRSSWGFQKRFSDVEIRTVFLIGLQMNAELQVTLNEESQRYRDIIQANYTDTYYNNTYKTMSGLEWVMKNCQNAKFYMFIDDDYYISTKNVLRFLKFPTHYPEYLKAPLSNIDQLLSQRRNVLQDVEFELAEDVRLYTGFAFASAGPHRHLISKWYVSLEEYPYHLWPPYVSGGAYILSKEALQDMYYASFFTKHFRFDDIYLGILAYRTKIEPFHSEFFHFNKKRYNKFDFKYVIASHGYGNYKELVTVWNEQKSLGNA